MTPAWIDVDERLPEFGRYVKVWGEYCVPGYRAPVAYRRREALGPGWFWCSAEARGSNGIFWWWDGPCEVPADRLPTTGNTWAHDATAAEWEETYRSRVGEEP